MGVVTDILDAGLDLFEGAVDTFVAPVVDPVMDVAGDAFEEYGDEILTALLMANLPIPGIGPDGLTFAPGGANAAGGFDFSSLTQPTTGGGGFEGGFIKTGIDSLDTALNIGKAGFDLYNTANSLSRPSPQQYPYTQQIPSLTYQQTSGGDQVDPNAFGQGLQYSFMAGLPELNDITKIITKSVSGLGNILLQAFGSDNLSEVIKKYGPAVLSIIGGKLSYDDQKRINDIVMGVYNKYNVGTELKNLQYRTGQGLASLPVARGGKSLGSQTMAVAPQRTAADVVVRPKAQMGGRIGYQEGGNTLPIYPRIKAIETSLGGAEQRIGDPALGQSSNSPLSNVYNNETFGTGIGSIFGNTGSQQPNPIQPGGAVDPIGFNPPQQPIQPSPSVMPLPSPNNPSNLIGKDNPFFNSNEYNTIKNSPLGVVTHDMYNSPYFGSFNSSTIGSRQDKAYEDYMTRIGTPIAPAGFIGQPVSSNFGTGTGGLIGSIFGNTGSQQPIQPSPSVMPLPSPNNPSNLIGKDNPFFNSNEYNTVKNYSGPATHDMYNSPYFGSVGSGTTGSMMDKAYEDYMTRIGTPIAPVSQQPRMRQQPAPGGMAQPVPAGLAEMLAAYQPSKFPLQQQAFSYGGRAGYQEGGRSGYQEGGSPEEEMELKNEFNYNRRRNEMEDLLDEYQRFKMRKDYQKRYPRNEVKNGGRMGYAIGSTQQPMQMQSGIRQIMQPPKISLPPAAATKPVVQRIMNNPEAVKALMKDPRFMNMLQKVKASKMQERPGYRYGSPPVRTNQAGITELDYRQKGGFVPPIGVKEKADDIPAMLSNNEFVFTANAVRNAGGGSVKEGAKKMYGLMRQLEGRA